MHQSFGRWEQDGNPKGHAVSRDDHDSELPHTPEPYDGLNLPDVPNVLVGTAYLDTPVSLASISPSRSISPTTTARVLSRSRSASPRRNGARGRGPYVHPHDEATERFAKRIAETTVRELQEAQREGREIQIDDLAKKSVPILKEYHPGPKTGWELLQQEFPPVRLLGDDNGTGNTQYKDTEIDLSGVGFWGNFPTYQKIYEFSKSNFLNDQFHEIRYPEGNDRWNHVFGENCVTINESDVVDYLSVFFKELRGLIRCSAPKGHPTWVSVGAGEHATERRRGGYADGKKPDKVAFWTDKTGTPLPAWDVQEQYPANQVPCLIPGDYKRHQKFSHERLQEALTDTKRGATEMGYVLNQIHDYMDMHHCRYGYVITETELIMFRRRKGNWGQLDYSPAFPIQCCKQGELTALMVLWYFHVKHAMRDEAPGYRLESAYSLCIPKLGGGKPAKRDRERNTTAKKGYWSAGKV